MVSAPKKYSREKVTASYEDMKSERHEWEQDARLISDFLLPGRGIYQTYAKPRKRKLTSPRVINTVGEDSLYILTSGLHGRLTSPAMQWFRLGWSNVEAAQIPQLKFYIQDTQDRVHDALHASNFYSIINSFYVEYAGFGNGCIYTGEDTDDPNIPFRFELLTFGEYVFGMSATGQLGTFARTIFMSPRQLVEKFPKTASDSIKRRVKENQSGADKVDLAIIEYLAVDKFQDKNIIRLVYEITGVSHNGTIESVGQDPLQMDGFYEHPYQVGRWNTIGSDTYGIGPGSRAIPDIKRLQEMEKAFLMATHKAINPPLNAPVKMKGKVNSLPGGNNYYSNPGEIVSSLYDQRMFDYQGVSAAVERVEQRIQRNFFNDVFINSMRDPNASPLKATQVVAQEQEKMFRLGPVVERLYSEVFTKLIHRCVNIMDRKGMLMELSPDMREIAGDMTITLISPMAVAQKTVKSQGTDAFMGFVGQVAQFDQSALDKIDIDAAIDQKADIEGVDLSIVRTEDAVAEIRARRAEQQRAAAEAEAQAQATGAQNTISADQAGAAKDQAEAGLALAETQEISREFIQ